jgi:hypothetical protein
MLAILLSHYCDIINIAICGMRKLGESIKMGISKNDSVFMYGSAAFLVAIMTQEMQECLSKVY